MRKLRHDACGFIWFLAALFLVTLPEGLLADRAPAWRVFKASDGLVESFTDSVTVSLRNNVWATHGGGAAVSWLDGYEAGQVPAPFAGQPVWESLVGQRWAVYPEGIQEFRETNWVRYPVADIALKAGGRPFPPLLPVRQGRVLFLLPERLMEFSNENIPQTTLLRDALENRLGRHIDMIPARDGGLWMSGANGIAKSPAPIRQLRPESEWREFLLPAELSLSETHRIFEDDEGGISTVAGGRDGGRVLVYFNGREWSVVAALPDNVRQAWRSGDVFRAITPSRLLAWDEASQTWAEQEEVASEYLDVATDRGGVFWLATSEGLYRHTPLTWRTPRRARSQVAVHAVVEGREGQLWLACANGLHEWDGERYLVHRYPDATERVASTHTLFLLADGTLVLGGGPHLLRFHPGDKSFRVVAHPSGARLKAIGKLRGDVCVQVFDETGRCDIELFNGTAFQPFLNCREAAGAGTELAFFFASLSGDFWIGGGSGVALYGDGAWNVFDEELQAAPDYATSMVEFSDTRLWCGARDKIWEFDGKKWTVIQHGFDRVNAMLKARDGGVWVASNAGVHRFFKDDWSVNEVEDGLPGSAVAGMLEDRRGRIWAATSRGVSLYHPDADLDPPQSFVQKVIQEKTAADEASVTLVFGGRDKWKFTAAERLLFSYRLDEQDWSPWQSERSVTFPELASGRHYFQVRAMDRNGNIDAKPALLEFAVAVPWYREARLVAALGTGVVAALFFAGVAFNRHRRLMRSYAEIEKIVALRTQQLDQANQELFHSQKMNALGTLAAGIAHDFNNILSIVKGSAQIIEKNLQDPEKIRTRVDRIKTVVDQGSGIVKAMLGFSRETRKQFGMCDVNAVVDETITLLGDRFLREVQVVFARGDGLPQVCGSKDFMQQIVLNLIFNAADALYGPGKVVLATGEPDQQPDGLLLAPQKAVRHVTITVTDTGCGIAPDILPRIFEPFFTTKGFSARRGTGLGLSMVYELAKEMGFGLKVESEVGKGSTFSIIMPAEGEL